VCPSHIVIVTCPHHVVVPCHCCIVTLCCPVSQQSGLGRMWEGGYSLWCSKINNDKQQMWVLIHHLVATSLSAMWHLDFVLEKQALDLCLCHGDC